MTARSDVVIRRASRSDAAAFRELRLRALTGHPESFGADAESEAALPMSHWEKRIDDPNGAIFVAENDGQLVGVTGIYRPERIKLRHNATIWGVYVLPQWRGAGLAARLIEGCLGWAEAASLQRVRLAVVSSNDEAVACYRRCGFEVYGVEPDAILLDGKFHDELLMQRPVRRS